MASILWLVTIIAAIAPCTDAMQIAPPSRVSRVLGVDLVFAGKLPEFMEPTNWRGIEDEVRFSSLLSHFATLPLPDIDTQRSTAPRSSPTSEVAMKYSIQASLRFANAQENSKLDIVFSKELNRQPDFQIPTTSVADQLCDQLARDKETAKGQSSRTVTVLVWSPKVTLRASQYTYKAGRGSSLVLHGMSSKRNCAFIDVNARGITSERGVPSLGDMLSTATGNMTGYAFHLGQYLQRVVSPPRSPSMHRLPPESRLAFKVIDVDASSLFANKGGPGLSGSGVGSQFDVETFEKVVRSLLEKEPYKKETVIERASLQLNQSLAMALAVSRAIQIHASKVVIDPSVIQQHILYSPTDDTRVSFFADTSFVAHVPLMIVSFSEPSRTVQFAHAENRDAVVLDSELVLVLENRANDHMTTRSGLTAQVIGAALELLCGLQHADTFFQHVHQTVMPVLLSDIAKRNVVQRELEWSFETAVKDATSLLRLDGHDPSLIPHEPDTLLGNALGQTKALLQHTMAAWEKALDALDPVDVMDTTYRLTTACHTLRELLYTQVCSQPMKEEIALEAESEGFRGFVEHRPSSSTRLPYSILASITLGLLTAWLLTYLTRSRSARAQLHRASSPLPSFEARSPGGLTYWLRSFASRLKPKLN